MAIRSPLAVTVAATAVVLAGLAVWGFARELPDFWDPCMHWGFGQSGNGTAGATLSPGDSCRSVSGTSETRGGAALRLAAVDGTAFVAAALAAAAAWRRSWKLVAVAAVLLAGETVLLFFGLSIAFVLTLALAILYIVAARRWSRPPPLPTPSDGL